MADDLDHGGVLRRGGREIAVEREPEVFTAILAGAAPPSRERLRALPGVSEVATVEGDVVKLTVAADARDLLMGRLRAEGAGAVVHHAYRPEGGDGTRYYLTDRIVARFAPEASDEAVEAILGEEGVRILRAYPDQPRTYLLAVTASAGRNPLKVANSLATRPEVELAEPDLINRFQPAYVPADPGFAQQWHLRASSGPQVVAGADVGAVEAWDITRGERSVAVAVIDDGFDLSHPDLGGAGKVVAPSDYADDDTSPLPSSAAGDYHGTPCAGVAIAEENGVGTVGAAPGCAFVPIRFDLTASDDQLWDIFDHAGRHADVISCSWGPPPVFAPLSTLLSDKLTQLATTGGPRKRGCVICFAAGNYNAPLDDSANVSFRWSHPERGVIQTRGPILNGNAAHPHVVAVAASTSQNRKAAYSNWGGAIALAAPSNNFHPLEDGVLVPGRGIHTTDNEAHGLGFTPNSRYTSSFGGTSSACPLAAGVAALVLSANPELTGAQVRQILTETADKIEDREPDPVLGLRKGTYDAGGHSEWFGHGKVSAARAVRRARELVAADAGATDLSLGRATSGHLEASGASRQYRLRLGKRLVVSLAGPDGADFDLYLRRGEPPTRQRHDARGSGPSADERVALALDGADELFVLVRSYRGSGDFELTARLE